MDMKQCIKSRRSIRRFEDRPVTEADVRSVVELAAYAPSWKNTQTVRYTAILDPEVKQKLAENCLMDFAFNQKTVAGAPAVMVLSTVDGRSGYERDGSFTTKKGTHWQSFDAGIAAQTFCLAAHGLGYGTVIMGIFDPDRVAQLLQLPQGQSVSALIAFGYAEEEPQAPARKEVQQLLSIR